MAKKIKYTEALDPNKPHLGGNFIEINPSTYCPQAWKYLIDRFNIKSVLDVGSGRGHAAKWFAQQNLETYAIDGLEDNILNAVHPTVKVDLTETYFSKAVDLVNCIEVVEHVDEKYLDNLLKTLCSGKYIFMTHGVPGQEGHHHVNCQPTEYWLNQLNQCGYIELTQESETIRTIAKATKAKHLRDTSLLFVRN
jgi:SAM-dependent methyltransferase